MAPRSRTGRLRAPRRHGHAEAMGSRGLRARTPDGACGGILTRMGHIDEDDLEAYALDRLPEEAAAPIEEHLLICEECQDRLLEWDEFLRAMLGALPEFRAV